MTNGRLFAEAIKDGRSGWSRRVADLLSLHIGELGGEDAVSTGESAIIRRIATITTELEWIEQKFKASKNGPSNDDLDLYLRGSNSLRRLLESIGIRRDPSRSRDVTPLNEILAQLDRESTAVPESEAAE